MDFPEYVPAAVREHIAHYLEGEPERSIPGYVELRDKALRELLRLDGAMQTKIRRGEEEYLPSLRSQRVDAAEHHALLTRDVCRLERLSQDLRMRDAFIALELEKLGDEQMRGFIHSAWSAGVDFSIFRKKHSRAKELAAKIAGAAAHLESLIQQFSALCVTGPSEFYSIPVLLRKSDNHDMQDHNLHMWRAMRRHVLGDIPTDSSIDHPRSTQTDLTSHEAQPYSAPASRASVCVWRPARSAQ